MEIKSCPLNRGEVFPCSYAKAKKIFINTPVILNFAYTSRIYGTFCNTPDRFFVKKNINGTIIASMYMRPMEIRPMLCFYVLKEHQYSNQLRKEFEDMYLNLFFDFYSSLAICDSDIRDVHLMLVELKNNCFSLHQTKYK
jgi:hypothetical protein